MVHRALRYCANKLTSSLMSKIRFESNFMPSSHLSALSTVLVQQKFDYFLVLDFEATCDANKKVHPQEIIEFPCLKLNAKSLEVDSVFHHYVKPDAHPILSPFCTELTGIVQAMVDTQPNLVTVLEQFDQWLMQEGLNGHEDSFKWAFVTCGEWDLKWLLPKQAEYLGVKLPSYFHYWINVKKPAFKHTKVFPRGMMHMLETLKLSHEGRHHSGIDDSKNIANIVKNLCQNGVLLELTSKVDE